MQVSPLRRLTLYPTFTMYVAGVLVACAGAMDWIGLDIGVVILTTVAGLLIVTGVARELHIVHTLVDSQRAELLERIDNLTATLDHARIVLPASEERPRG